MPIPTTASSPGRSPVPAPFTPPPPVALGRCRKCGAVEAGIEDGDLCGPCFRAPDANDAAIAGAEAASLEPDDDELFPEPKARVRGAPGCPGILVAHLASAPKPYVYVGRQMPGLDGSPLGNPFRPDQHDDAIGKFRRHLGDAIAAVKAGRGTLQQRDMVAELLRLHAAYREGGRLTLACWCAPHDCHADVIAAAVVWLCREERVPVAGGLVARWESLSAADGLPWVVRDAQGRVVRRSATPGQAQGRRAREIFPDARTAPIPPLKERGAVFVPQNERS